MDELTPERIAFLKRLFLQPEDFVPGHLVVVSPYGRVGEIPCFEHESEDRRRDVLANRPDCDAYFVGSE